MPIQSTDRESTITFGNSYDVWTIKSGVAVTVGGQNASAVVMGVYGGFLDNFGALASYTGLKVASGATASTIVNHAGGSISGLASGIDAYSVSAFRLHNAGEVHGAAALSLANVYGYVENDGLIVGSDSGMEVAQSSLDLDNTGTIQGAAAGVRLSLQDGDRVSLHNAGLISASPRGEAIYSWTGWSGALDLVNDGRIDGGVVLEDTTLAGSVLNAGTISGPVSFGSVADRYDGRAGVVLGAVSGGDGNDLLLGGTGDDTLIGGGGRDRLDGGKGDAEDVFVFADARDSKANAPDLITKHWSATDTIDLSAIDANTRAAGQQHLAWGGAVTAGAALTPGSVGYYQQDGDTFVVFDNTGDGVADFRLEIHGKASLNAGEFVL